MRLVDDDPDVPAQINVVPMIDVIFAILTFFIVSTLFLNTSQGFPINLPQASTSQAQGQTQINVSVDAKGVLSLNNQLTRFNDLIPNVQALMGNQQQALVVVYADRRVSYGQVVTVMDRLRQIPGVKIAIATERP